MTGGSDMWVRLHDFETGQELEVCKGERLPRKPPVTGTLAGWALPPVDAAATAARRRRLLRFARGMLPGWMWHGGCGWR